MPSIALIGPDGAGKTTLTRLLQDRLPFPVKYLYMGINMDASNVALPTSRLIAYLKRRGGHTPNQTQPPRTVAHQQEHWHHKPARTLRAVVGLIHRLAEEWYRQLFSWFYQMRGYIVLYDRHFLFDFAISVDDASRDSCTRRLHRWCVRHVYPRPKLVIYLDAPAEVLFARKGEWGLEALERRRQAFLQLGKQTPNFVQVDATQPLDEVYAEVTHHILQFMKNGGRCVPSEAVPAQDVSPDGR
jgi:thymidylate kinase